MQQTIKYITYDTQFSTMEKCQLPIQHQHYNLFQQIMTYISFYVEGCSEEQSQELEHADIIFTDRRPQFTTLILIILDSIQLSKEAYNYIDKISNPYYLYEHLSEHIDQLYDIAKTGKLRHEKIYTILATEEQLENKVTQNIRQIIGNPDLNRYLLQFV